ncbi:MAG TPA: metal ABC transporter permease [Streptosporangiaceae bacterium]|jgi:zinc/manganese transport system permease protein|nr:metal ABC transporter permease [Streptosporangiaceae bacterium]
MYHLYTRVIEPGFFASAQVHAAAVIGGAVAVISAVTGVFTVLRGQSFGGHALTDVSTAGGSGALLAGVSPVTGFVGLSIIGAGLMETIGIRRARGRDLATGIVLGASIGLGALFLYLDTTASTTTGATQQILFGSIFTIGSGIVPVVVIFSAISLGCIALVYRPLLLTAVSTDMAAARGVPVRLVGMVYMLALAVSVGLSSLAIGSVLSTALLIGPAAAALRVTKKTGRAVVVACLTGTGATWLGVLLAYDSYYWSPGHQGLPVSFFIVALVLAAYLLSGLAATRTATAARETAVPAVSGPGR